MSGKVYFSPEILTYLSDLKENNSRDWFQANKSRYEEHVKQPFLEFIGDFATRLGSISKHIRADPRPNGGSLFRIYRDVRFSKNKDPYKTHAAAQFRHEMGKDVHAPGFYFHIQPGTILAGSGIWHPDSKTLRKIREGIDEQQDRWISIKEDKKFKSLMKFEGESLKRNPQGFDINHPLIEDLKRKDFMTVAYFEEADIFGEGFMDQFVNFCEVASPFMKFIADAAELPY